MFSFPMSEESLEAFRKKHGITTVNTVDELILRIKQYNITVKGCYGDCTAFTLFGLSQIPQQYLKEVFDVILDLMSYTARINAFFSIKANYPYAKYLNNETLASIKERINSLKKLPVTGLNFQHGSRHRNQAYVMISGILKCPNPYHKQYEPYTGNCDEEHDCLDDSHIKELALKLGF